MRYRSAFWVWHWFEVACDECASSGRPDICIEFPVFRIHVRIVPTLYTLAVHPHSLATTSLTDFFSDFDPCRPERRWLHDSMQGEAIGRTKTSALHLRLTESCGDLREQGTNRRDFAAGTSCSFRVHVTLHEPGVITFTYRSMCLWLDDDL